ncbi:hypothetical protein Ade02nite_76970 [Paractinoplanes deccanensis]|uniref:Uncharacterized protein n=1 Tax=Paractinoplanes deccanensis TaxID=113561 RepID=A0ABQ3YGC3_9ACTN|nr:hypothetical protein [Actinoplanes deccanensis]GID79056.1 hypothetical protein Ade02nite_76970 [Actinoplanes deccanensis]
MFATMRRKNRNRRMRNELGQSVDHFKRAASLAAQETSATVGPTLSAAVDRVQPAAVKAKDAATTGWGSAVATITPLVAAATDNVKQAGKVSKKSAKKSAKQNKKDAKKLQKRANKAVSRKEKKGRGSKLLGFALLGTAVGVGAAYVSKRRRAAQWDEYEPAAPLTTTSTGADDAAFEPISPNGTVPTNTTPNTPR